MSTVKTLIFSRNYFIPVFRTFYILLQIYDFVSQKNYSCQTNYIMNYRVNYININAKATFSRFRVSLTIIEKTSSIRISLVDILCINM